MSSFPSSTQDIERMLARLAEGQDLVYLALEL
jgi:hypothetical protein